jgi:hypothetical protein
VNLKIESVEVSGLAMALGMESRSVFLPKSVVKSAVVRGNAAGEAAACCRSGPA